MASIERHLKQQFERRIIKEIKGSFRTKNSKPLAKLRVAKRKNRKKISEKKKPKT